MATTFSILLAVLLFFYPQEGLNRHFFATMSTVIVTTGAIFLVLVPLLNALVLRPIQKAGMHLTSLVIELFRKDRLYQIVNLLIVSFSILCFAIAIDPGVAVFVNRTLLFSIWLIFLGVCIDGLWFLVRRSLRYISPVLVARQCFALGRAGVQENRNAEVWKSMDGLTEIGMNAIERQNLSLATQSFDHLEELIRHFLESCKSISRSGADQKTGNGDEVSYALLTLLQRLNLLQEKAFSMRNEAQLSHLLTTLAKISLSAAALDLSLVPFPVRSMGQLAQRALDLDFVTLADRTLVCLVEVAKAIIEEVDLSYAELQPPFLTLISVMEQIAHGMFKKDKSMQLEILTQPFRELEQLLGQEKIKDHQDTPSLKQDVQRVLVDFGALESILQAMPEIPSAHTEAPSDIGFGQRESSESSP